ncbi:MAG: PIN domain-containing protein [Candidatus Sumerlaeota bacterium]|nr:PIN domain-containing protein [Candidatus Sumerlaeota bacterium]
MTEQVLVDTDVFSYLMGERPEAHAFRLLLNDKEICLSFISIGELFFGAYKKNWGEERFRNLRQSIGKTTLVPYDEEMPERYGMIVAECERKGRPIALNDAWIATVAVTHGLPLITNNFGHFEVVSGLNLLYP